MKKVLIVGAGNIGTIIAHMLSEFYNVIVVDSNEDSLKNTLLDNFETKIVNVFDHKAFAEDLKNIDYVVNAGPYLLASDIAHVAAQTKTNYLDLTEDVEQSERIKKLAIRSTDSAFISQCGLAPGFISIVANDLANKFDSVSDVKMRVGALPMYPNNALKYNMTWSTDGLINEYLQPCHAIKNGELVSVEPLEGYETFGLDGDRYEAFNTSGGLGTLCETWKDKVQLMDYKTVRYLGHRDLMKFLIDDMKLGENNGIQLKEMMNRAIPMTNQDVVLIFVTVTGMKDGKHMQETWTKKIYGQEKFGKSWSAIQLTTAAGICSMLNLHDIKKLPAIGFIKQEDAKFDDFMTTPYGWVYE